MVVLERPTNAVSLALQTYGEVMEKIKSPGKTLMNAALYIFAGVIVLMILLMLATGGLQGWHVVIVFLFALPVCLLLFLIGIIMHLNFKTKMQIIQAQAEQNRQQ